MSMTLLASNVLGSSAASVTFSSIDQSYKTLRLVVSARDTSTQPNASLQPNGASTSLSRRDITGNGATASSGTGTSVIFLASQSTDTANTFSNVEISIPNYAGSSNKAISIDDVNENNGTTAYQRLTANLWSSTSAITSLTLTAGTAFAANSSFYLYGLK